jgi:hypothetical protein
MIPVMARGGDVVQYHCRQLTEDGPMNFRRMIPYVSALICALALLGVGQVTAQEGDEGEDPIQALPKPAMKLGDEQGTVIRAPTPGMRGATPIEIPFWPAIDPRRHPDLFKALPLPIPGDRISTGRQGQYEFKENADGLVMGQTRFGYAYFYRREQYYDFLRRYP